MRLEWKMCLALVWHGPKRLRMTPLPVIIQSPKKYKLSVYLRKEFLFARLSTELHSIVDAHRSFEL